MNNGSERLDADELMHLALHATQHDTPDKAISHLKRLLDMQPENGRAHYLLGALHAEIGMHDQAAEEMSRAIELEPGLPATARFQLGLLHITAGRVDEAEQAWRSLDELGDQDPLFLFKTGMLHLVRDEFEECAAALRSGIEKNQLNEDLNNDMRKVLLDAESAAGISPVESAEGKNAGYGKRMLLSVYERDEDVH